MVLALTPAPPPSASGWKASMVAPPVPRGAESLMKPMRAWSKSNTTPYFLRKTSPTIQRSDGCCCCWCCKRRPPPKRFASVRVWEHVGPWSSFFFVPLSMISSVLMLRSLPSPLRKTSVSQRVPSPSVSTTTSLTTASFGSKPPKMAPNEPRLALSGEPPKGAPEPMLVPSNGSKPIGGINAEEPGRCVKAASPRAPEGLRRSAVAGCCWICGTQRPPPTLSKRSPGDRGKSWDSPKSLTNVRETLRAISILTSHLQTTMFPACSSTPQSRPKAPFASSVCMKGMYRNAGAKRKDVPVSKANCAGPCQFV
mmetsp:Transcript_114509/g.319990  ORF Transcript_114509/g.319990 Transcript_114509/m.319990 type:complete len:310 (-) Transcript_114509:634-1563(-)